MQVHCPHCHNPIEIVDVSSFKEIPCPTCGSSFNLVGELFSTENFHESRRTVAHFELIDKLGVGGFGTVWKAKDTKLDRIVAIKIPRKEQLSEEEIKQFRREARAAAQLRHANIVAVHEVGRDGDTVYIVSDFVDGLTLSDWLTGQQPPVTTAVELCVKIATALHAAHEQGIVHRDLKPSNIVLDRDNNPHVMDFGLAKREAAEITIAATGQVLGTPAYMSPEQARGEGHTADRRADLYSLGVILFELLTGELPFRGNQRMLIHQVLTEQAPSPKKLNSNVPADVETITLKCLEKAPDSRFSTAMELHDELQRFLASEPIKSRPVGKIQRTWRWCKRQPTLAILLATTTIFLIMFCAGGYWIAVQQNEIARQANKYIHDMEVQQAERVLGQVDALRSASPDSVPYLLELLGPSIEVVAPQLRTAFRADTDPVHRLHVAMALAYYGLESGEITDFIVASIGSANGEECPNIVSALSRTNADARSLIQTAIAKAEAEDDWEQKAKLAIVMLHLGALAPASDMLQFKERSDPIQRTVFIETIHAWHGDLRQLAAHLHDIGDGAVRSGICLGVGGIEGVDNRAKQIWGDLLAHWYVNESDAGTHSAAGWALRTWNLTLPKLRAGAHPEAGNEWTITPNGLTMLRIPAGEFVRKEKFRPIKQQTVRITHDFLISDREITVGLFQQYIEDTEYGGPKTMDWPGVDDDVSPSTDHPVHRVNWHDTFMFCNWLSHREELSPCYERTGADAWRLIDSASGYRLPSEAQWEYTCRAGTRTLFAFGEDETRLSAYGVYVVNSNARAMATGTKLCNAWGLFDMHGNVSEWCGDRYGSYGERTVLENPRGPDAGSDRVLRGGSWYDAAEVCRSSFRWSYPLVRISFVGFRVARVPVCWRERNSVGRDAPTTNRMNHSPKTPLHETMSSSRSSPARFRGVHVHSQVRRYPFGREERMELTVAPADYPLSSMVCGCAADRAVADLTADHNFPLHTRFRLAAAMDSAGLMLARRYLTSNVAAS